MLQLRVSVTDVMKHACCVAHFGICSVATVQFTEHSHIETDFGAIPGVYTVFANNWLVFACVLIVTHQYRANERFCDDILILEGL